MTFDIFGGQLSPEHFALLVLCLVIALGFEVVNGFHDTANAVATVIYTRSLRPVIAVIWSGICNFFGVFLGGIAVALAIVHLLPIDLLVGTGGGLAAVLALLVAAVLWNLGTWFYGLPASSSHALIGAILGVGLANSLLPGHAPGGGVNWGKAEEVGLSLLLSPAIGFSIAALLLWGAKKILWQNYLYQAPDLHSSPPGWVRAILILTCTGVSFAHGSNDGQKGVGLIMLVLIALLPAHFALNLQYSPQQLERTAQAATGLGAMIRQHFPLSESQVRLVMVQNGMAEGAKSSEPSLASRLDMIGHTLSGKRSLNEIPNETRWELRKNILEIDNVLAQLEKTNALRLPDDQARVMKGYRSDLRAVTDYAPFWVLIAVALALGIGTMIGWKRIVVTVGEKIGMDHLSYAQGAAAELVAMGMIGVSTMAGLPVSTTHVLASGVAGTMVANNVGLHSRTIRKIAMAWVLTLPVSMVLAGGLFLLLRLILHNP
jgi:PiT family inorganic phosphate transporter